MQGGKATHTQGKRARRLSHQATCNTQTSAESCSDPPPTEKTPLWWEFITQITREWIKTPIATVIFVFAQHFKARLSAVETPLSCLQIPCGLRDNWIYIDQGTAATIRPARVASPRINGLTGYQQDRGCIRNTLSKTRQAGKSPSSSGASSSLLSAQGGIRGFSSKQFPALCFLTV